MNPREGIRGRTLIRPRPKDGGDGLASRSNVTFSQPSYVAEEGMVGLGRFVFGI